MPLIIFYSIASHVIKSPLLGKIVVGFMGTAAAINTGNEGKQGKEKKFLLGPVAEKDFNFNELLKGS